MPLQEMISYIDICKSVFGSNIQTLQFTGGECMLNYEDVLAATKYAYSKYRLISGFLTNCFWATSRDVAHTKLKELHDAGIWYITVSTGADHREGVPLQKCIDVITEAFNVGFLTPTLRVEVYQGISETLDEIKKDEEFKKLIDNKAVKIDTISWMDFNNETIHKHSYKWKQGGLKPNPCYGLFDSVCITPYGDVMACCGIACTRIPFLRIGNIKRRNLDSMWRESFNDMLKIWLMAEGPSGIMRYVQDHTTIRFPSSWSRCDTCLNLFADGRVIPFLKSSYNDWCHRAVNAYERLYGR